jgi:hypothetical protein
VPSTRPYRFGRNFIIVVPHTGHFPLAASLPFFVVTTCASLILRGALHLTQYASMSAGNGVEVAGSGRAMLGFAPSLGAPQAGAPKCYHSASGGASRPG